MYCAQCDSRVCDHITRYLATQATLKAWADFHRDLPALYRASRPEPVDWFGSYQPANNRPDDLNLN